MKGDKIVPKPGGVLYSAFILLPLSGTPTLLWSPNATLVQKEKNRSPDSLQKHSISIKRNNNYLRQLFQQVLS